MNASVLPLPGTSATRRGAVCAVILVTLIALVLRLTGIGFVLPHMIESDGAVIVRQVELMKGASTTPEAEDNWSYYPHLVARAIALLSDAHRVASPGASLDEHLAAAAAPNLRARVVVAWLSILMVPGTWLLARRFVSAWLALFAASLIAVSLLDICLSQESRPHAPAAAFALFAVLAAMRLSERGDFASYLLAGIAGGLAIGSLQSGVAVLFPLAAAHFLREKKSGQRAIPGVLAALAILALCFAALYPFLLQPTGATNAPKLEMRGENFQFFGHTIFLGMFNGAGFGRVLVAVWSFETATCVLAAFGLVAWIVNTRGRRGSIRRDLWIVLLYVVPYFVVIGMYERTYQRFVLQLLPFVACLAAFGAGEMLGPGACSAARRAGVIALMILALAVQGAAAIRLVAMRAGPDNATLAARWLAAEPGGDTSRTVILYFIDVPLPRSAEALAEAEKLGWRLPWHQYQSTAEPALPAPRYDIRTLRLGRKLERDAALSDPWGYLQRAQGDYVLLPVLSMMEAAPVFRVLREALQANARLVYRSPSGGSAREAEIPLDIEDSSAAPRKHWIGALLSGNATAGDVFEIYRVR